MSGTDQFPYPGDDPTELSSPMMAFDANKTCMDTLITEVGQAASSLRANWKSDAATEAGQDLTTLTTALQRSSKAFADSSVAVASYRSALIGIRSDVDDLRRQFDKQQTLLGGLQSDYARAVRFGEANEMTSEQITQYRADIAASETTARTAISRLQTQYDALVTKANRATTSCDEALHATISGQAYNGSALVPIGIEQTLGLSNLGLLQDYEFNAAKNPPQWPSGKDPAAIYSYWMSLPPGLRAAYIRLYPDQVGNMNGVPIADRSTANVSVATADRARFENVLKTYGLTLDDINFDASANVGASILRAHGMSEADVWRYKNAVACLDGMGKDSATTGAPSYLMIYDPTAYDGKGRAAICIGDPDTADDTAVCVPGLKQQVSNQMGNPDAQNLYNQMMSSDPTHSHAVVQWMGYNAPGFTNVASENSAVHGAVNLANDVAALQATHQGAGHLTVVGHSYGSVTTADACKIDGMRPDDVVLIGSPGTGHAHSAADLGLPPGHVYDGAASHDEVTHIGNDFGALGTDPAAASFGATRFHAESTDRGDDSFGFSDHSRYYQTSTDANGNRVPSESLMNISDIATGNGDRIRHDGELAPGRYETGGTYSAEGRSVTVHWYQDDEYKYGPKWGDPTQ